jgi:dipeptidase
MAMPLATSILLFSSGSSKLPAHHFNFLLNVLISFYNFYLSTNIVFKQGYQNYILTSLWWKFHKAKIHATWNCSIYAHATQKEMEKDDIEGVMTSQISNLRP